MDILLILKIISAFVVLFVMVGIPLIKDIRKKNWGDVKLRLIVFVTVSYIVFSFVYIITTIFQRV